MGGRFLKRSLADLLTTPLRLEMQIDIRRRKSGGNDSAESLVFSNCRTIGDSGHVLRKNHRLSFSSPGSD